MTNTDVREESLSSNRPLAWDFFFENFLVFKVAVGSWEVKDYKDRGNKARTIWQSSNFFWNSNADFGTF